MMLLSRAHGKTTMWVKIAVMRGGRTWFIRPGGAFLLALRPGIFARPTPPKSGKEKA
jgi:hypothetical protein